MTSPEPPRRPATVRADLLRAARIELIPLKSVDAQLAFLPAGSEVTVTCSPAKGLDVTIELAARLRGLGHHAVPHVSARLVEDVDHVRRLAKACRQHGFDEVFLVAGDVATPAGPYDGVVAFLRDFLDADAGVTKIGVTAYPDAHPLIDDAVVHEALHAKQALLAGAGVAGYATTQMCFDIAQWRAWARRERASGLRLPLQLGVPGVIDRARLLTIGVKLGVGQSMRYVSKNRGVLSRLLSPTGYDPSKFIDALASDADELGIDSLHLFTFNSVERTVAWRDRELRKLA
jgi:methylenetetrahydrofolate reductase (NADPH)